jgi:hypothetical protein
MAKIALLLGVNPRLIATGPYVPLRNDNWRFEIEGLRDSVIHFYLDDQLLDGDLIGSGNVQARIVKPGTEPFVSVFARSYVP